MKKIIFIFLVVTSFWACNNQETSEENKYKENYQQIIDVHDEVMPRMGKLGMLIERLEPKIDTTTKGKTYMEAAIGLKEAHTFMMEWMVDFSEKFPNINSENEYTEEDFSRLNEMLAEEKKEVKEMRDKVNSSIEKAEKLLNNQ